MRHALYFPPFGALSEPAAIVEIACAAEASGWDGLFLWDHVLRADAELVGDAWVTLAAVAARTERLRIGPMVTPLTRRRIATVVRQTVALDRLSDGRLVLGVGLGVDTGGELSRFGEVVDARTRGARLDEAADLVAAAWTGETVQHRGEHFLVDGVRFLPTPVQSPPPIWCAARGTARRPVLRAARFQGLFPIEVGVPELKTVLATVGEARGGLDGFDVAVMQGEGHDPALLDVEGVTWALLGFGVDASVADVLAAASAPPR